MTTEQATLALLLHIAVMIILFTVYAIVDHKALKGEDFGNIDLRAYNLATRLLSFTAKYWIIGSVVLILLYIFLP